MVITLPQRCSVSNGDIEAIAIEYVDWLDEDELLTGTPTIVEVTTTALTLGSKAGNTVSRKVLGRDCLRGQVVQCSVSGQAINTDYRIRVTVSTTASRTIVRDIILSCR